jgi:hypothetical protein
VLKQILDSITPIFIGAIVTMLGVIIKQVMPVAVQTILKYKGSIEQVIEVGDHEKLLSTAKEIWNIVEENYRIKKTVLEIVETKAESFNKLLLEKVPGLTEEEINYLRQTIAGEFNKGKEVLTDTTKVIQENEELKAKNQELQVKLNQVNSLVC